eukprot:6214651-Pleurochrysis_carterae.AAC.1
MSGFVLVVVFAVVAAIVHVLMTRVYEWWCTTAITEQIDSAALDSKNQLAWSMEESPLPNETVVVGAAARTDEGDTMDPPSEESRAADPVSAVDKYDRKNDDDDSGFMWQASEESVKGWSAPSKEAAGMGQILTCNRVLPMQIRCSSTPGMDTTGALRPKLAIPPVVCDPIPWHDTDRRLICTNG